MEALPLPFLLPFGSHIAELGHLVPQRRYFVLQGLELRPELLEHPLLMTAQFLHELIVKGHHVDRWCTRFSRRLSGFGRLPALRSRRLALGADRPPDTRLGRNAGVPAVPAVGGR